MSGKSTVRRIAVAAAAVTSVLATPALADAYHSAFKPGDYKYHGPGNPNEVLVLGTMHLSQVPFKVDAATVEPLLQRLEAWKPQEIAIENVSGMQCFYMRHYPARYQQGSIDYCYDPTPAGFATGLDVPAANAEMNRALAAWPASPSAAQRRHLAALMMAAGEPTSALVQWLRLPETERHAGDGLDETLVEQLGKRAASHNESGFIAARLGVRLGLERLWPIDDHSADSPDGTPEETKAAGEAIMAAWKNPVNEARDAQSKELEANVAKPGGFLAMYRAYNAPAFAPVVYNSDMGAALNEPSSGQYGRGYAGWWEVRNLRMASNIRDVLVEKPGTRMLVIVGASHKFYLESYLDQMHDVSLADTGPVLR